MTRKFLPFFLLGIIVLAVGFAAAKTYAGTCYPTLGYCDSDVTSTATLIAPVTVPYSASCQTIGGNIFVLWTGSNVAVTTVTLQSDSDSSFGGGISDLRVWNGNLAQNGGQYVDGSVPAGTSMFYRLEVGYNNGTPTAYILSNPKGCTVGSITQNSMTTDAPTNLEAFAYTNSSIYLTWRNNLSATSSVFDHFAIQRLQLTTPPVTNLAVTAGQNGNVLYSRLTWSSDNTKGNQDLVSNHDVYTSIQRSASASFDPASTNALGSTASPYTDNGVGEGVTYYYKAQNCLTYDISPYYTANNVTDRSHMSFNSVYSTVPDLACSASATNSVTVPPLAPTGLAGQLNAGPSVLLSWTDHSSVASGIELRKAGCGAPSTVSLSATANSYPDNGSFATPCSAQYSVYAYVLSPSGTRIYSSPSATTVGVFGRTTFLYDVGRKISMAFENAVSGAGDVINSIGQVTKNLLASVSDAFAATQTNSTPLDSAFPTGYIGTTTISVFMDNSGLQPGMIYLYRVALVYKNGSMSAWSNVAASKTLPSDASAVPTLPAGVHLCIANNVCSGKQDYKSGSTGFVSEEQCQVNSDCANVGNSSQVFQEK